jgi:hypothetical protein
MNCTFPDPKDEAPPTNYDCSMDIAFGNDSGLYCLTVNEQTLSVAEYRVINRLNGYGKEGVNVDFCGHGFWSVAFYGNSGSKRRVPGIKHFNTLRTFAFLVNRTVMIRCCQKHATAFNATKFRGL